MLNEWSDRGPDGRREPRQGEGWPGKLLGSGGIVVIALLLGWPLAHWLGWI